MSSFSLLQHTHCRYNWIPASYGQCTITVIIYLQLTCTRDHVSQLFVGLLLVLLCWLDVLSIGRLLSSDGLCFLYVLYEKSLNCALLWHRTFFVLLYPTILCSFAAWSVLLSLPICSHYHQYNWTYEVYLWFEFSAVHLSHFPDLVFFISCVLNEQGFYPKIYFFL